MLTKYVVIFMQTVLVLTVLTAIYVAFVTVPSSTLPTSFKFILSTILLAESIFAGFLLKKGIQVYKGLK